MLMREVIRKWSARLVLADRKVTITQISTLYSRGEQKAKNRNLKSQWEQAHWNTGTTSDTILV